LEFLLGAPEITLTEWDSLGAYLSERVGQKVTIVPLKITEVLDFCRDELTGQLTGETIFVNQRPSLRIITKEDGSGLER